MELSFEKSGISLVKFTWSLLLLLVPTSGVPNDCFLWNISSKKQRLPRIFYDLKTAKTGGDNSNKGCFGRKTNLFRESGDFAGNRETWKCFGKCEIFSGHWVKIWYYMLSNNVDSDMHPVYALYFMYFDSWKLLNSPWYEKTNQQRFQLK